jgi:WD40 repeat protein
MAEAAQPIIPINTPNQSFEGHEGAVTALVVFPDGRRMVTGSKDKTLCLWDLKVGHCVEEIEGA